MNPPLERLLKDGAFEFQMGMRRGDDEFFQNRAENRAVLEERRRWLAREPERYAACEPELDGSWFRAEHQAFRLLPERRSILFAIRIEVAPLREIAADRALAARLAAALLSMPPEIAAYKGVAAARVRIAEQVAHAAPA